MSNEMMPDKGILPAETTQRLLSPRDLVKARVTITLTPKGKVPALPPMIRDFNTAPAAREFIKAAQPDPKALGSPKQALARRARFLHVQPHVLQNYTLDFQITQEALRDPNPVVTFVPDTGPVDSFDPEPSGGDVPEPTIQWSGDRDATDWSEPADTGSADITASGTITWLVNPGTILGDGPGTPDRTPVHDRPSSNNSGGLQAPGPALPSQTSPIPQDGGEAEDGGEDPWAEA